MRLRCEHETTHVLLTSYHYCRFDPSCRALPTCYLNNGQHRNRNVHITEVRRSMLLPPKNPVLSSEEMIQILLAQRVNKVVADFFMAMKDCVYICIYGFGFSYLF